MTSVRIREDLLDELKKASALTHHQEKHATHPCLLRGVGRWVRRSKTASHEHDWLLVYSHEDAFGCWRTITRCSICRICDLAKIHRIDTLKNKNYVTLIKAVVDEVEEK
ncbi:MAG: hypothetical protein QXY50_02775 [Candidatus Caldarchaeum sp.]